MVGKNKMLVAYILNKARFQKIRIVREKEDSREFEHMGLPYDIDPDCVYSRRTIPATI